MTRRAKIVAVLLTIATAALADPDPTKTGPATPTSAPAPTPQMSVAEMNVSAKSLASHMAEDSDHVQSLQLIAKKQKDVIKLNCVNDRLVQMKAQRNIADATLSQLSAALEKNSEERFTIYQQFQSQTAAIADLDQQAKACIGEPDLLKQDSGVTVDHPPLIDDPTVTMTGVAEPVEPPGYASPYD